MLLPIATMREMIRLYQNPAAVFLSEEQMRNLPDADMEAPPASLPETLIDAA